MTTALKMCNENRSFASHQVDCLRQHCLRANYLAYLVHHPSLKDHISWLGASQWSLSCCLPDTYHSPAQLPEPELSEDSEKDEDYDDKEDNC